MAKLGIAFAVTPLPLKIRFQAVFLWPAPKQETLHRFIAQLIDGPSLNPAEVFKRGTLFGVDSQRECYPGRDPKPFLVDL